MKKRLILLAGLGVGFILGSRTGRQSYERLKAQAQDLWTDPRVQDTVEKANQSIREKSPAVADAVQTAADKVNAASGSNSPVSEFDGDEDSSAAPKSDSTKSSTAKPAAAESGAAESSTAKSGAAKSSAAKSSTAKPAAAKTGAAKSSAAKSGAAKSGAATTETTAPGAKKTGSPKTADSLADPERDLEDEGPAGGSEQD